MESNILLGYLELFNQFETMNGKILYGKLGKNVGDRAE